MNKFLIINAGHGTGDPGAIYNGNTEYDWNCKIVDETVKELQRAGISFVVVPQNLTASQEISWVNSRYKNLNDGLCLSIHLNSSILHNASGAECLYYFGKEESKNIATKLIDAFCNFVNIKNRGAVSDISTHNPRGVGWIRQTIPWSVLLEVGFIDSQDLNYISNNLQLVARGIVAGVCGVFGKPYTPVVASPNRSLIKNAYLEVLGRTGDEGGIQYYDNLMAKEGWNILQVRGDMTLSKEFKNRFNK